MNLLLCLHKRFPSEFWTHILFLHPPCMSISVITKYLSWFFYFLFLNTNYCDISSVNISFKLSWLFVTLWPWHALSPADSALWNCYTKICIYFVGSYIKYDTEIFCNTLDVLLHHLQGERVKIGAGFLWNTGVCLLDYVHGFNSEHSHLHGFLYC